MLNGKEFVIAKDGKPAARLSPVVSKVSPAEISNILDGIRRVFASSKKRKTWSVIDTPAWKKKEKSYLKDLSKGNIS